MTRRRVVALAALVASCKLAPAPIDDQPEPSAAPPSSFAPPPPRVEASVVVVPPPAAISGLAPPPPPPGVDVEIHLERKGCITPCPEYEVAIYGDGTVLFHGRANVKTSEATGHVAPVQVAALAARIRAQGFFAMDDAYTHKHVIGRATAITTIRIGKEGKRIEHYEDDDVARKKGPKSAKFAPPALTAIEQAIDAMAGTAKWIR